GKSAPPAGVGSQRVLRPLPSTSPSSVRRPAVIWKSGTIHAASRRRAPSTSRRLRRARTTAYTNGEEPENENWVLDFSEWASVYRTWLARQAEYRNEVQRMQGGSPSLKGLIRAVA